MTRYNVVVHENTSIAGLAIDRPYIDADLVNIFPVLKQISG